jgi:hypothetical protein
MLGQNDLNAIVEKNELSNPNAERKERKSLFKKNNNHQTQSTTLLKTLKRNSIDEQLPKRSRFLELKKFFSSKNSVSQTSSKKSGSDQQNKIQTLTLKPDNLYDQMNSMKNELAKLRTQLNYEISASNGLKCQIKDLDRKLNKKPIAHATTQTINYEAYNLQKINDELNNLRQQIDYERKKFENEKDKWLCEKEKVLKFQNYLQINYAQSLNQNKILRNQIEMLTMNKNELKTRHAKLNETNRGPSVKSYHHQLI